MCDDVSLKYGNIIIYIRPPNRADIQDFLTPDVDMSSAMYKDAWPDNNK